MPKINVSVEEKILDWILSKKEIEILDKKTLDNIYLWKNGEKQPTFNQIKIISKKMNIPLGYFFLKEPPKETFKIIEYRTIDSIELENPSRNLIDTIYQMEDIQEWIREYLIDNGFNKLDFVGSQQNQNDVFLIANNIRKQLELEEDWFYNSKSADISFKIFRKKMENIGVFVMTNGIVGSNTSRKLDIKEFRAFTLIDKYAPLIFINNNDSKNGKLFSLLHEAVHIWLGKNSLFNDISYKSNTNSIEILCNAVASEILVPKKFFIEEWKNYCDKNNDAIETIEIMAKYIFNCGSIVIARKALDCKFIDKKEYMEVNRIAIEYYDKLDKKEKAGGGNYYNAMLNRLDNRFLLMLDNSTKQGKTSYTEAYHLTNTNKTSFEKIIKKVGDVM